MPKPLLHPGESIYHVLPVVLSLGIQSIPPIKKQQKKTQAHSRANDLTPNSETHIPTGHNRQTRVTRFSRRGKIF